MNIFKRKTTQITIPVDNAQTVTELESFTVSWTSYIQDYSYAKPKDNNKVFINELDAIEFRKQLEESAKFINTTVHTKIYKN